MRRVLVSHSCSIPCPSCAACRPGGPETPLAAVLDEGAPEILLGGGDATRWPPLDELLAENRRRQAPRRIWVEAPARAFDRDTLARLARGGAHGVLVQIEAVEEAWRKALRVSDGEAVIAEAEAVGLATRARLCVRPKTFPMAVPLAARLAPRPATIELVRQDWNGPPLLLAPGAVEDALLRSPNLSFSADRLADRGYLPPCVLPSLWAARPDAWRDTFRPHLIANAALPACTDCALRQECRFNDAGALADAARREARPIPQAPATAQLARSDGKAAPARVRRPPPERPPVICVTPWTTMEVVDPDGRVRQCCSDWTVGARGSLFAGTLASVWNGEGYREARRIMGGAALDRLCNPVCPRLYDRKFAEDRLEIVDGAEPFLRNQLLVAEEIAERRETVQSKPLYLVLCPSTYCNYDCIMCTHGRTPRRDLPESIWDELPEFLPTLRALTLLGGEPLANPLAMRFLRQFDRDRYPDAGVSIVTNGSLLGEGALKHMRKCSFANVTVSLNAGTPEAYERVQRGIPLAEVLANVDALIAFRDAAPRPFPISLSFVVQPANAHDLIPFGELARARLLGVRLLPLSPGTTDGLDYYDDGEAVARVLGEVDRFIDYAATARPDWLPEIRATREAIFAEHSSRRPPVSGHGGGRLPLVRV